MQIECVHPFAWKLSLRVTNSHPRSRHAVQVTLYYTMPRLNKGERGVACSQYRTSLHHVLYTSSHTIVMIVQAAQYHGWFQHKEVVKNFMYHSTRKTLEFIRNPNKPLIVLLYTNNTFRGVSNSNLQGMDTRPGCQEQATFFVETLSSCYAIAVASNAARGQII